MEKTTWKCGGCGYTFEQDATEPAPMTCPSCKNKCEFLNVTCYIPECNFTGADPKLG